jgi:hypothetical protein
VSHVYSFKRIDHAKHLAAVEVIHNGKLIGQLNLFPQMWYGYTTVKLRELVGKDNSSDILNHGKTVTVIRDQPILNLNVLPTRKE